MPRVKKSQVPLASKPAVDYNGFRLLKGVDGRTLPFSLFLASRTCLENGDGIWLKAVQVLAWEPEGCLSDAGVRWKTSSVSICKSGLGLITV